MSCLFVLFSGQYHISCTCTTSHVILKSCFRKNRHRKNKVSLHIQNLSYLVKCGYTAVKKIKMTLNWLLENQYQTNVTINIRITDLVPLLWYIKNEINKQSLLNKLRMYYLSRRLQLWGHDMFGTVISKSYSCYKWYRFWTITYVTVINNLWNSIQYRTRKKQTIAPLAKSKD